MKKVILSGVAIAALLFFNFSCEKETEIEQLIDNTSLKELTPLVLISNYDLLENPKISDASLEEEFELVEDGTIEEEIMPEFSESNGEIVNKSQLKDSLYLYLSKLNLSREQAIKIKYSLQEFNTCKLSQHRMLRAINKEIIGKANKERNVLIQKYKEGKITKEELEKSLLALKIRAVNAMRDNPARKKILENLHKCHLEFIENLRLILSKDQWEKLLHFLKSR